MLSSFSGILTVLFSLSTDKRRLVEMKREAQGTPVPPVQGVYDWYKAQKRKREHDNNGRDNEAGDSGSGDH